MKLIKKIFKKTLFKSLYLIVEATFVLCKGLNVLFNAIKFIFNIINTIFIKIIKFLFLLLIDLIKFSHFIAGKPLFKLFLIIIKILIKLFKLLFNVFKKFIKGFFKWVKEIIEQAWTLLGMFVAWIVLTGSSKAIVGYAIIVILLIWLLTLNWRNKD